MHINIYYLTEDEKYMCLNLFGKTSRGCKKYYRWKPRAGWWRFFE